MSIEVTLRHVDNNEAAQRYAHQRAQDLMDEFPRIEHVHVILDEEKHGRNAEFVVQGSSHIRLGARETGEHFHAAIDLAWDKIEVQLRRSRDKVQDHKPAMKKHEQLRDKGNG